MIDFISKKVDKIIGILENMSDDINTFVAIAKEVLEEVKKINKGDV